MRKDNIVLIGMPGAGKSTVGVVLAKRLGCRFVDSDLVIQERYGRLLHELIEERGVEGFWKLENDVNASLDIRKSVIATGGSVIYGEEAMEHLRRIGMVIYLKLSLEEVEERLGDLNARGVTLMPGQTLADLYEERVPLYEKYADLAVDVDELSLGQVLERLSRLEEVKKIGKQG